MPSRHVRTRRRQAVLATVGHFKMQPLLCFLERLSYCSSGRDRCVGGTHNPKCTRHFQHGCLSSETSTRIELMSNP